MYPLLILREEIVCLIILVFLLCNGRFYKMGKDHGSFMRMCIFALGHVIYDIITVLTVNHLDLVPAWANLAAHIIFYLFAILFSQEFLCYTVSLCYSRTAVRRIRIITFVPIIVYTCLLPFPFMPIEYLAGNGTNYSLGPAAFVGYGLAMALFLCTAVVVVVNFKRMAQHVRLAIIPMLALLIVGECVQIAVPELLFTGGAATIITVGFFFSLENPADVFRQKLLVDALTGMKSRHSYELDIQRMEEAYHQDPSLSFGVVFCDINNLKAVNDNLGHMEGDAYIGHVAQILMRDMHSAEGIYRMGGDEFLAIYCGRTEADILQEINAVRADCEAATKARNDHYEMSVAIGYAMSGPRYASLKDVLRLADFLMYKDKATMKRQMAIVSADGQTLNISGLTDRIFDAFSATGDRNYLTLCNLSTNVSRWSRSAVDYFGLPDEFIYDCASLWMDFIHPDDRADYWTDINDVLSGKKKYHDMEYRVRNKAGQYVMCTCRGAVLRGKNGEPDMFAATLVNHGIAESIDPVTGLHGDQSALLCTEQLLRDGAPAAFLMMGVFTFSRINLLYGYSNGNEVLRQLTAIAVRALGGRGRIFRLEGTRFLLCLPGFSAAETLALYKTIRDAANQEILLDGITIPLRLAGGAFLTDGAYTGSASAVRNDLTLALDTSKLDRHGRLVFYGDLTAPDEMSTDPELLARIHQDAVTARSGFFLKYQPILSMDSGRILGAEALLRWRDEDYGEVASARFVPWLESDPSFYQLGRWILRKTLADVKALLPLCPDFTVNVNVTVFQLEDERFDDMVVDALRDTDFPPEHLCLELTERCRELDFDFLEAQINFFHSLGIRVALDDVGTGFASLGVLLKLPVDEIKLDKTFITDICRRKVNQVFVRAIVDAARSMGYHSCLEGIEDEETYNFVRQFGATSYQGYYFSRPLPPDQFRSLLERQERGETP